MFGRTVIIVALMLLPALYAARVDHRPAVTARAARGTGAAEGRAWVVNLRREVSRAWNC